MEAFSPPIEVPAIMSIFILLLARALKTPQPKAPKEPPPCSMRTFSILSDMVEFYRYCCEFLINIYIIHAIHILILDDLHILIDRRTLLTLYYKPDNSLPNPLFFTPPNGTLGSETTTLFTVTIPD